MCGRCSLSKLLFLVMGNAQNIERGRRVKVKGCEMSREYITESLRNYSKRVGVSMGTVQMSQSNNGQVAYVTRVYFEDVGEVQTFLSSDLEVL